MASIPSNLASAPTINQNLAVLSPGKTPSRSYYAHGSSLLSSKFLGQTVSASLNTTTQRRPSGAVRISPSPPIKASSHSFDVVVVGAGIIGLSIARQFLLETDLSVAVVDAAVPCSGATGAGQGYLWMVHKSPRSDKWELAMRSRKLWEAFAHDIQNQGMNPLEILGWKQTGSLLVGTTQKESSILREKVNLLSEAGLRADFLSSSDLQLKEPALMINEEGGAAFLPDDCQLDARRTVEFIEKVNRHFAPEGRYAEFYNEPATSLLRSGNGEVNAVQTSKSTLCSKKAVVVATGCWSGSLLHDLMGDSNIDLDVPIKPRKGHLLVIENFTSFKLNHGLMEAGYVDHQAAPLDYLVSAPGQLHAETASVSMTATMDACGNLILGSSRQLVGYNTEIDESIINRIWQRAGDFFPDLQDLNLKDLTESRKVRVGLRPYMPDGKPVIGQVPALSNLFLAAGHEGEGLSLALGTAEMVADMVLGNSGKVNHAPFALESRCCMSK